MVFAGYEELLNQQDPSLIQVGFFDHLVRSARANWSRRNVPRLPSAANWTLRSALLVTKSEKQRIEKQLEKAIATALQEEGWAMQFPQHRGSSTAGGRQMNIDLVHRISAGIIYATASQPG